MNKISVAAVKNVLSVICVCLIGFTLLLFCELYVETYYAHDLNMSRLLRTVLLVAVSAVTVLTLIFSTFKNDFIYKLALVIIVLSLIAVIFLFYYKKSGLDEKISTVEDFRSYIASFGAKAALIFILISFLQVVVLPIPAFITVGAGVLIFGPFLGAVYSVIGIVVGSVTAYFIGKIFGVKAAVWLVGEAALEKWRKFIYGKDRILLTFMFLFPFFPDDVLCFVAGITTVKPKFFIVMITVVRVVTVFLSSYSINNSIIPYTTWWGIALWVLFFSFTIFMTILIYKKGDVIEKEIFNRKHK